MDGKRMIGVGFALAVLAVLATGSAPAAAGTGAAVSDAAAITVLQTDTPSTPSATAPHGEKKWHFTIPFGIWPFAVSGPVGIGDYETDVDMSMSDVQDLKDLTLGGALEAGYDKVTGLVQVVYMRFEPEVTAVTVPEVGTVEASPRLEMFIGELAVAYRAFVASPGPTMFVLEPLAGVRYTQLQSSVHVEEPDDYTVGDRDLNWTDGFIGVRGLKSFTPHIAMNFRVDAGGGGSNLSWNAGGGVGYRFPFEKSALTVALGYKATGIDIETDTDEGRRFFIDQVWSGPTLGVAYSF